MILLCDRKKKIESLQYYFQILNPATNKWQRVGHLPGAILINTGKLLENWTSGAYKALVSEPYFHPDLWVFQKPNPQLSNKSF